MKIIFLDVDGVLNSNYSYPFDKKALLNLKSLVLKTNAKIVIISSLRKDEKGKSIILNELNKYDLDKYVIGCTSVLNNREEEIKEYLENIKYSKFVILDDVDSYTELSKYFVKVNRNVGISKYVVIKAIKCLHNRR